MKKLTASIALICLCFTYTFNVYASAADVENAPTLSGNIPKITNILENPPDEDIELYSAGLSPEAAQYCTDNGLTVTGTEITNLDLSKVPEILEIPEGVTAFFGGSFKGSILKEITFPSTFEEFIGSVFKNAGNVEKVDMSKCTQMSELPLQAFMGCTGLDTVVLPEGIETIGSGAFIQCSSLKNINFPSSLTSLSGAFQYCTALETADLSACTNLTSLGTSTFLGCTNLSTVKLPDTLPQIMLSAFSFSGLTSLTLPEGLDNISSWSPGSIVEGCNNLVSIDISKAVNITNVVDGALAVIPATEPDPSSYPALSITISDRALAHDKETPWILSAFRWYAPEDTPSATAGVLPARLDHFVLDCAPENLYGSWSDLKALSQAYSNNTGYPLPESVYSIIDGSASDVSDIISKEIITDAYLSDFGAKTADELWADYYTLFKQDTAKAADIYGITSSGPDSVSYTSFMDYCLNTIGSPVQALPEHKLSSVNAILQNITAPIAEKADLLPQSVNDIAIAEAAAPKK